MLRSSELVVKVFPHPWHRTMALGMVAWREQTLKKRNKETRIVRNEKRKSGDMIRLKQRPLTGLSRAGRAIRLEELSIPGNVSRDEPVGPSRLRD
jgi:hypothetical protein